MTQYPIPRILLFLCIGIALADHLRQVEAMPFCWALCLALSLFCSFIQRKNATVSSVMILTSAMFLGSLTMSLDWRSRKHSFPQQPLHYSAVISNTPRHTTKDKQECDLLTTSFSKEYKLKAYIRSTERLHEGDTITCTSRWNKPKNFFSSKRFDYALYLRRHGYAATTFIDMEDNQLSRGIQSLRSRLLSYLRPDSTQSQDAAIVSAMVLGDRSQLSPQTKTDYSSAGVSHVLALSGLHVSILLSIISLFLLGMSKKKAAVIKLFFVWSFTLLVGSPISLLRVAIMLTIMILADSVNRITNTLSTLFTAAFLILLFSPQSLYDVGFQLSFTSVFFIVGSTQLFREKMYYFLLNKGIIFSYFFNILFISLAAQLGTLPLILYHFGQFPTYFLLSNIFIGLFATIILLFSVITILVALMNAGIGMLTEGVTFLADLHSYCQQALSMTASLMNSSVHFIASLPYSSIRELYLSLPQVFFVYLLIALLAWRVSFSHQFHP